MGESVAWRRGEGALSSQRGSVKIWGLTVPPFTYNVIGGGSVGFITEDWTVGRSCLLFSLKEIVGDGFWL